MHVRQEVRDQVPLQVPQRPPRGVQVRRPVQGAALRGLQDNLRQAVQEGESERRRRKGRQLPGNAGEMQNVVKRN